MTPARYELVGSRVLITGGAGFVGSHSVDQVIDAGATEVLVIDNLVRGRPENLLEAQRRGAPDRGQHLRPRSGACSPSSLAERLHLYQRLSRTGGRGRCLDMPAQ